MIKKLRIQLTIIFVTAIGFILFLTSAFCIQIAEWAIKKNNYAGFINEVSSVLTYLDSQKIIRHEWAAAIESTTFYQILIYNNGKPMFIHHMLKEIDSEIATCALHTASETLNFRPDNINWANSTLPTHNEFYFKTADNIRHYASAIYIPKSNGYLTALLIYDCSKLNQSFISLKAVMLGVIGFIILILTLFFWRFTLSILQPIEQNHQKQISFLASASHELRTPLSVILSNSSALKKASPAKQEIFINNIMDETRQMSRLVNDMLVLASSETHHWHLHKSDVYLDILLLETFEKYEHLAVQKHINLSISLPNQPVPPYSGDRGRLFQVLSILVDNALCYTPANGTILLSLLLYPRFIKLIVSDTGPGVSDDEKDKIFERFYRSATSTDNIQHYGLGLSIAREIISLHKGNITVEDAQPAPGTKFIVTLHL